MQTLNKKARVTINIGVSRLQSKGYYKGQKETLHLIMSGLFHLANVFEVQSCCSMYQYWVPSLLLNSILLYGYTISAYSVANGYLYDFQFGDVINSIVINI